MGAMGARAPLPFTVIGGFLGAGKTTLLNHWLRHAGGQRLAVLVNDFGTLNIDARLIDATHGDTIALSNGCVCCQIGDDLSLALIRVLERAEAFDAVVVEASGVSDPWRVAQMGRADPGLRLDGVIVLVDAEAALAQARDPLLADTLERQLKAADLVVLNHCDRLDDREPVRDWIAAVAGAVPRFETAHAVVPLALLSGLAMPRAAASGGCGHDHSQDDTHEHGVDPGVDHGSVFDTWSARPPQVFDTAVLRDWLRRTPPGLLRLKGVLRTGEGAWSEIQFAGRHGSVRPTAQPGDGPALVAIGLRGLLPTARLEADFREPR